MAETRGITRRDLFRFAAASGVTAAVGLNLGEGGPRAAAAQQLPPRFTPEAALEELRAGNARFLAGTMTSFNVDQTDITNRVPDRHNPFAAILSCADARVTPEILFDQPMGELFVARVAGNIATAEIIASLEFAVAVINPPVSLIMVLGHGLCGAVVNTDARTAAPGQISALYAPIRPAVNLAPPNADIVAKSKLNAVIQAILIRDSSPLIARRVRGIDSPPLRVVAAYYNLVSPGQPQPVPNGQVDILDIPPAA